MLMRVELTFRIFIGIADPVPRKTTSGYWPLFSMERHTSSCSLLQVRSEPTLELVKSSSTGGAGGPTSLHMGLGRGAPALPGKESKGIPQAFLQQSCSKC